MILNMRMRIPLFHLLFLISPQSRFYPWNLLLRIHQIHDLLRSIKCPSRRCFMLITNPQYDPISNFSSGPTANKNFPRDNDLPI